MTLFSNKNYPPLRRKILRSIFWIILSFIVLGIILIAAVFITSGITPKLIRVNYDSIAAAQQMEEALIALRHPEEYSEKDLFLWQRQFDEALQFEEGNITEPGEKEVVYEIRTLWSSIKERKKKLQTFTPNFNWELDQGVSPFIPPLKNSSDKVAREQTPKFVIEQINKEEFQILTSALKQIVAINEQGMFSLASQSRKYSQRIFYISLTFFIFTILLTLYLADRLSFKLAQPLKNMAEFLRHKPNLNQPLKLPEVNTLELSILRSQLIQLWDQLSALDKINLKEIISQRNQLQTVLSSVEDGILVLNNDEKIVLCNQGMAMLLGVPLENILHHSWRDLSSLDENYIRLRDFLNHDLSSQNSIELKMGRLKMLFAARYRKIYDDQSNKIGSLYLLHDVTQKVAMQRLKEEFISVLSHELKTPLQSLSLAADLLNVKKEKLDEDSKLLLETIQEDLARIRALSNDFIQVGQPSTSILKLNLIPKILNQLLPEWMKPFKLLAQDKKVCLTFKNSKENLQVNLDLIKFPWALSNLFSNALRVSPPASEISISLFSKDQYACLEVADEGPGISSQAVRNIFEPYFQDKEGKPETKGFLGIGLTIAKEIVEAHGGKISYEARKQKGSIFKIELPIV